jgi:hypothetical protein
VSSSPGSRRPDGDRLIRASELSEFAFCPRAWWLEQVLGLPAANWEVRAQGRQHHRRHGLRVQVLAAARCVAIWMLAAGAVILAALAAARLAR